MTTTIRVNKSLNILVLFLTFHSQKSLLLFYFLVMKYIFQQAVPKVPKDSGMRRRTHADNIPDSEKPFACDCKL